VGPACRQAGIQPHYYDMIKILILGGGFGGIRTALDLERKLAPNLSKGEAEITLVDKNGYHLFTPDIYEVASAYGIKRDPFAVQLKRTICIPYADIFAKKHINFIQAEITEVDLIGNKVKTGGGHTVEYDYLVFALGSEAADYNIPGVKEYAHQFKTLEDSLFINKSLDELSEQFKSGNRTEPFSFLICGGGFTGVELAAELGCCSKVIKDKCKLRGRCSNISLFEAGPKIMSVIPEKERKIAKERLTDLGIMIIENSPIEEIGSDFIKLKSGQKVNGDLIIWTTGIKPNRIISEVKNLPLSQSGKITTEITLHVKGYQNIFAVGDSAEVIDPKTQRGIPALAYVAVNQGKIVAGNIFNSINNKKMVNYKPFYDISIVPIGGKYAVAHLWGGWIIKGFWGWIIRQLVDIRYLLSIFPINKTLDIYWNEVTIFSRND